MFCRHKFIKRILKLTDWLLLIVPPSSSSLSLTPPRLSITLMRVGRRIKIKFASSKCAIIFIAAIIYRYVRWNDNKANGKFTTDFFWQSFWLSVFFVSPLIIFFWLLSLSRVLSPSIILIYKNYDYFNMLKKSISGSAITYTLNRIAISS